jgi:hypothetical protein
MFGGIQKVRHVFRRHCLVSADQLHVRRDPGKNLAQAVTTSAELTSGRVSARFSAAVQLSATAILRDLAHPCLDRRRIVAEAAIVPRISANWGSR